MTKIRIILAPTDFSEPAGEAVEYAADLAERLNAKLILLHVMMDPMAIGIYDPALAVGILPEQLEEMRAALSEKLETLADKYGARGISTEWEIQRGTPTREIVEFAAHCKADMIVMGTHGRRGINRLLLGSVAERVIRTAPCPVLATPPSALLGESAVKQKKAANVSPATLY